MGNGLKVSPSLTLSAGEKTAEDRLHRVGQNSKAIENYSNPFYWREKLADCYLAWCMPIYYGCTRITDYFPAESIIQIDTQKPKAAIDKIQEAIANKAWQQRS